MFESKGNIKNHEDLLVISAAAMVSLRSFLAEVWMTYILLGTSTQRCDGNGVFFMGFFPILWWFTEIFTDFCCDSTGIHVVKQAYNW